MPAAAAPAELPKPPEVSASGRAAGGADFIPAATFSGAKPGYVFQAGSAGMGYYRDGANTGAGSNAGSGASAPGGAAAAPASQLPGPPGGGGWVGMRTVAELRREAGIGAPRNADSLYRPIERAPRRFNPLKIPRALQARPIAQACATFPSASMHVASSRTPKSRQTVISSTC